MAVYNDAPESTPAPAAPAPAPAPEATASAGAGATAAAGAGSEGPGCASTLHDFVLGLLQDASAMKAFELDPVGCLKDAGLPDITPEDVKDVIPLVTDLVPTGGLPGLPGLGAVPGLDSLTSGLSLDVDGGTDAQGGWIIGQAGSESALGDIQGGLAAAAGLDGVAGNGTVIADTALGSLDLSGGLVASTERVAGVVGVNADTVLGDLHVSGLADTDGTLLDTGVHADTVLLGEQYIDIDAKDGLGSLEISQSVLPLPAVGVGDLARGLSDPTAAASAIVGAVPALPAVPGLPQLPVSDLPLPSVPELPVVGDLPVVSDLPVVGGVQNTVENAADSAASTAGAAAAQPTDAVGAVSQTAGGLAGLGNAVPNVGGLVDKLPVVNDLPVVDKLPVVNDLPVVKDLPVVGGGSEGHGVVGDVVNQTGLGNVISNNPVTDTVGGLVGDLDLGL